ncbi:ankyrin repeat-containing protein [Legionella drozanskii LLAP-1]|uniref:Ankyrin repeat-containing protein n=2 Tax=Legionella TaxID=445 RepID=A0A0W0SRZ9_9GAMM|nr:ankyrin repeat domain-containing protein [Legionella drozanskii]KTC86033.1 ankyrin repeat-containing protein [Legionella drozanskii LLAP-1]
MYEKTEKEDNNEEARILTLPDEVLARIISYIHPTEILNTIKLVSRKFYWLSYDIAYWRREFTQNASTYFLTKYFPKTLTFWLRSLINWAIRNKSQSLLDSFYQRVIVTRYKAWKEENQKKHLLIETTDAEGHTQNHWAAICNQLAEFQNVERLPLGIKDARGRTALVIAAKFGHLDLVTEILAKIDDDNDPATRAAGIKEKNLALRFASDWGHFDIIEVLLNHGANLNSIEDSHQTVLMAAVANGHYDMVEFLLKKGADVNVHAMKGTALLLAVINDHLEIVRLLLKKGAKARFVLDTAVFRGQLEMIKVIFEETNDSHLKYRALLHAIQQEKPDIVRFFAENTTHKDAIGSDSFEALLLGTEFAKPSMVQALCTGVNFNSDTIRSTLQTLLTITVLQVNDFSETSEKTNQLFELIEILHNHDAKIEDINDSKEAALRHLIAHSVKITSISEQNNHFHLHFNYEFTYAQYLKKIKFLLEKGTDINTPFRGKKTALMHAAQRGHVRLVELLLEKGANVNATDDENNSALISAAEEGHLQIVALLLKSGVSQAQKAEALARATTKGQLEVVNLLRIEMVKGATVGYLDWRATEAPGHRLLNRFNHWYHGTNGIKRTENILHSINSGVSPTQLMQEVKSAVEDSSHRKHSYSRYIFDAFQAPPISTVNNQTDEEFLELKQDFLANFDQQFLSV